MHAAAAILRSESKAEPVTYPMHLTAEQIADLESRLASFKTHGILPANQAQATFGKVITSSDSSLKPLVCMNAINLKKCSDVKKLINDDLCGIINMSIERHNFISCDDLHEFKKHLEQRLFCTFVFIIDLNKIPDKSVAGYISHINYVYSNGTTAEPIPTEAILSVMIPENLKEFAAKFFKPNQIISVPVFKGNIKLSNFTLGTALNYTQLDKSGVIKDVFAPDYELAFLEFRNQNPELNYCGLHLSRFATQHCLQFPFKKRSREEATRHLMKQGAIHLQVRDIHPTLRHCQFSDQSFYTLKDLQAARVSLCKWLSNPKPVVLAESVKKELEQLSSARK